MNDIARLKRAGQRWFGSMERAQWQFGTIGRINPDESVTVDSPAGTGYVIVLSDLGTYVDVWNRGPGHVPPQRGLRVRYKEEYGRKVMGGIDTSPAMDDNPNAPGSVYAVNGQTGYVVLDPDDLDDAATTHKFTTAAEASKLAGIAAGAEVNVNADWSAVSGDALILNKPSIPTQYTDELAQDAVGTILVDSTTIDFTYTDATPSITAERAALTGDVTASAGSNTTAIGANKVLTAMIADAQVTLAKMANLAADTIIGRANGAGTGVPQALTKTQVLTLLNVTDGANPTNAANIASAAHGATLDTTPLDADEVVGMDSSASFALIRTTWTSIKAFLVTYFSTLYAVLAGTAGGQTLNGGTAANEDLTLRGTAHATKTSSYVILQDTGGNVGVGVAAPLTKFHVAVGTNQNLGIQSSSTETAINAFNDTGAANVPLRLLASAFRFEGGSVGIAAAPLAKFHVAVGTNQNIWMDSSSSTARIAAANDAGSAYAALYIDALGLWLNVATGNAVGIGLATIGATKLGIQAGNSTNDAAAGGVLYVDSAQRANTGTGETDLATYTVPANTLSANNMSLEFHAWGTITNAAATKTLKVYFGASVWTMVSGASGIPTIWSVRGRIIRTGAATQDVIIDAIDTGAVLTKVTISTAAETLSGAVVLKLTGQSGGGSQVLQEGFVVSWIDANI